MRKKRGRTRHTYPRARSTGNQRKLWRRRFRVALAGQGRQRERVVGGRESGQTRGRAAREGLRVPWGTGARCGGSPWTPLCWPACLPPAALSGALPLAHGSGLTRRCLGGGRAFQEPPLTNSVVIPNQPPASTPPTGSSEVRFVLLSSQGWGGDRVLL